MWDSSLATLEAPAAQGDEVVLEVQDVTGMTSANIAIPASMPAGEVATMVARELQLSSTDASWGLRNDLTSVYLDDLAPIGEQVGAGEMAKPVTLIPRAHLGAF